MAQPPSVIGQGVPVSTHCFCHDVAELHLSDGSMRLGQ